MTGDASTLLIGIDVGGSSSRVSFAVGDEPPKYFSGPAANFQRCGAKQTVAVLFDLIQRASSTCPDARLGAFCAGISGAGRDSERESIRTLLVDHIESSGIQFTSNAQLLIEHDATIAMEGAFCGGGGIILIAGTGSIAFARCDDGQRLRCGGWGYLIGDEGSGVRIGLEGLRAVAHKFDAQSDSVLRQILSNAFGIDSPHKLIEYVYLKQWPPQGFAPSVLDAASSGDTESKRIVEDQVGLLAAQVSALSDRCSAISQRIALMGGLMAHSYYHEAISSALRKSLPGWELMAPLHSPADGALMLARQIFRS